MSTAALHPTADRPPSTLLDAVQSAADMNMIRAAGTVLGLDSGSATATLGAGVTVVLGRLLHGLDDPAIADGVVRLVAATDRDRAALADVRPMLAGAPPASALHAGANRLLGTVFGASQATAVAGLATATGTGPRAAAGLLTLAAALVLVGLRLRLGGDRPTAPALAGVLRAERARIARAMPAPLRAPYGLADGAAEVAPAPTAVPPTPPMSPVPDGPSAAVGAGVVAGRTSAMPVVPGAPSVRPSAWLVTLLAVTLVLAAAAVGVLLWDGAR
jgi:hypothetical protein